MTYLSGQLVHGATQLLVGVVTAIPFAVLLSVCALAARKASAMRVACIGIGGLAGTLLVMIPGNMVSWLSADSAGPVATASMLGDLFLPFLTLLGLGFGLAVGWVASLLPRFNRGR